MRTEEFKQEFGFSILTNLFVALDRLLKDPSLNNSTIVAGCSFKMNIDLKKQIAFGSCDNQSKNISFEFELTFGKRGEHITYFHSNNETIKKEKTLINADNTKACTCEWSMLHSNNGCKCGAITPYKFKYN